MSPAEAPKDEDGFASLGLETDLIDVLVALGYEEPTEIQRESIPPLLEGHDLLGQAATGTGKTAAFALPLIQRMAKREGRQAGPSALILVPTRELAMQVAEAVHRYGRARGVTVLPIYGGQPFVQQLKVLKRGVDVAVATPGRALDHINRGTLKLDGVEVVVLDEADEMLDMGFAEDLEAILAATPAWRQTVLFSATIPPRIGTIAKRHLRDPVQIRIASKRVAEGSIPQVRQTAYLVPRAHKRAALARILDLENPDAAIVFCRTRNEVDELVEAMNAHGYRAEALHGAMSQEQRDRVMKKVRGGTADLLIATDIAARGLDIARLSHVINYDLPTAPESYVHRIGRVGRAGREGIAITLTEPREHRFLRNIELLTKQKIEVAKLPTVADLRARRLALVSDQLRAILVEGELDHFRVVVEALADEFDPIEIALAAVKMAQDAVGSDADEPEEIPEVAPHRESPKSGSRGGPAKPRGRRPGSAKLFVSAGADAGVRPQDLVGAITGEAGINGRDIGAIDIADGFSIVEVDEGVIDRVIAAMKGVKIKGKRVTVRRDQSRAK